MLIIILKYLFEIAYNKQVYKYFLEVVIKNSYLIKTTFSPILKFYHKLSVSI